MKRILALLLLLPLLAYGAVDLTAKPDHGTYTFNTAWTGANGATEPNVFYNFDEGSGATLDDLGSGAYDGTITGADWIDVSGKPALDFVSANVDYVTNLAAWGIANTSTDWTVAVIVSIDSGSSNDTYFSLGNVTLTENHASQVRMAGGVGGTTHSVSNRYHGGTTQSDNGSSYTATTWQLMWFRWTASTRTLKVFTDNGTEDTGIALVVTSGEQVPDSADGVVGAQATSAHGNPADARIAGLMVWNTEALTAAKMQDVYNGGEPWPFLTVGSCPAICTGGRTGVCITGTASNTDPDNILYGQSPTVVANQDTICHNATSTNGKAVTVSAAGWVTLASGGSNLTDGFGYCIMDNGAACGTDGTFQITEAPVLSSPLGVQTGQTTADLSVDVAQVEGSVWACVSEDSGTPSHAQGAAGNDANGDPCVYAASDATPSASQAFSATGLTADTVYYASFGQANAAMTPLTATVVKSAAFQTEAAGDTTPDAFAFTDVTGAVGGSEYTSSAIEIAGTTAATNVVITITGCEYAIDSGSGYGSYTNAAGVVQLGYGVRLRNTASLEALDTANCTPVIGGVSDTWTIITKADSGRAFIHSTVQPTVNPSINSTVY